MPLLPTGTKIDTLVQSCKDQEKVKLMSPNSWTSWWRMSPNFWNTPYTNCTMPPNHCTAVMGTHKCVLNVYSLLPLIPTTFSIYQWHPNATPVLPKKPLHCNKPSGISFNLVFLILPSWIFLQLLNQNTPQWLQCHQLTNRPNRHNPTLNPKTMYLYQCLANHLCMTQTIQDGATMHKLPTHTDLFEWFQRM